MEAPAVLDHLGGGAAAAVPVAEGQEEFPVEGLLTIFPPGSLDLGRGESAAVGGDAAFLRRPPLGRGLEAVGQDLGPVQAAPAEAVVWEAIVLVPAQFGGHEVAHAASHRDLGQGGRVAEGIGEPEHGRAGVAEEPAEVAPAEEELADEGLAGREVRIGLHPHPAQGLPAALGRPGFDLLDEGGVVLFHEGVELGLALGEMELRVTLHEPEDRGEGPGGLGPGLGEGPEPGHVEVGMADGRHLRYLVERDLGYGSSERRSRLRQGGAELLIRRLAPVDEGEGLRQGPEQSDPGQAPLGQAADGVQCHPSVVVEADGAWIRDGQGSLLDGEDPGPGGQGIGLEEDFPAVPRPGRFGQLDAIVN